jgi:hypothetical protein
MHDSRYNVAGATLFSAAIGEKYEREGVRATGVRRVAGTVSIGLKNEVES